MVDAEIIPVGSPTTINKKANESSVSQTFTPRQYQVELLDAALDHNTIVCLQTDSGKTFIAVMLIKELSKCLRLPIQDGGRRTVYLANSESLINNQANIIREHTNLTVGVVACPVHEDTESYQTQWEQQFAQNQVLITTAENFSHLLDHRIVCPYHINLLIFDECHYATDNHPYCRIMRVLGEQTELACLPRIAGLTASILHGKCKPQNLQDKLQELENTLNSVAETYSSGNLSRYSTKPKEAIVVCEAKRGLGELTEEVRMVFKESISFLRQCNLRDDAIEGNPLVPTIEALNECLMAFEIIGPLGLRIAVPLFLKKLQKIEKNQSLVLAKHLLNYGCTQLRLARKICENAILEDENPLDLRFVTPKVCRLVEVLKEYQPSEEPESTDNALQNQTGLKRLDRPGANQNSQRIHSDRFTRTRQPLVYSYNDDDENSNSEDEEEKTEETTDINCETIMYGIVFVNHHFLATVLDKLIRKLQKKDQELAFIKSSSILGHRSVRLECTSGSTKEKQFRKQEDILRRFRRHEINLLFATSAVEEGVDVPKCNLVVRFDAPDQYRSYIQSKGRARAPNSRYVVLVEDASLDAFTKELGEFQEIDKILQKRCRVSEQQSLNDVDLQEADSLCTPYKPSDEEDAPTVTMTMAIYLVNRYCSKLPSDTFTHLSPKCHTTVTQDPSMGTIMYQSLIYLPINSPIRDPIQGPPMAKRKLAEMAAALKTCELLHKAGELDDNLLPVGKDTAFLLEDFGYDQEVVEEGQGRPGTTKRRQYYDKEVAACLQDCHPTPDQPCHLYEIHMTLVSPLPNVLNVRDRKLHGPDETTQTFGLLTTRTIPKIPGFPVYTRAGELAVSIHLLTSDITVTSDQLNHLQQFHSCIFAEVLRLEQPNLAFDPEKAQANYLVVPLNKSEEHNAKYYIDWNFLRAVSKTSGVLDRPPVLPDYSRNEFVFSHEAFVDAVVTPIYRNIDQPQRYYIANILDDLPVTSPFPSDKYEKFIDYYFERYDIQVSNYHQPLLDVDCMSSRLNLLTPRYLNHKGKALPISHAQSKKNYLQKKQYLVPELCYIYPIPASLWRKAVCLPSILYRLNALIVAEEFRVLISREAGVGMEELPQDDAYPFENMSFGWEGLDLQNLQNPKQEDPKQDINKEGNSDEKKDDVDIEKETLQESDKAADKIAKDEFVSLDTETLTKDDTSEVLQNMNSNKVVECDKKDAIATEMCNRIGAGGDAHSLVQSRNGLSNVIKSDADVLNGTCEKPIRIKQNFDEQIKCASTELQQNLKGSDEVIKSSTVGSSGELYKQFQDKSLKNKDQYRIKSTSESKEKPMKLSVLDDQGHDPASLPGPSPTTILQSLTMSNSSDGFNLERLEMLGDSFLKQAITIYLYCTYPRRHEGKLSYMRSKQVSNFNLYRLGKRKATGEKMQVALFDPAINWLAPGFYVKENVPFEDRQTYQHPQDDGSDVCSDDGDFTIDTWDPSTIGTWDPNVVLEEEASAMDHDLPMITQGDLDSDFSDDDFNIQYQNPVSKLDTWTFSLEDADNLPGLTYSGRKPDDMGDLPELPYEIHTQHSLSDKNLADSVEAIIGCYLISCGFRSALIVMSWFGLRVLPQLSEDLPCNSNTNAVFDPSSNTSESSILGVEDPHIPVKDSISLQDCSLQDCKTPRSQLYGYLKQPESPFFKNVADAERKLADLLVGMEGFEETIKYSFRDKAYLVQAFTHASYHYNCVTDCYQRLEFLGDAILDYLITRHLYDHHQDLSPGALTDLRSALVNNTIFASLAVKFGYHKYFKALSPDLFQVINNFVTFVKQKNEALGMGSQLKVLDVEALPSSEDESEDIEVPKALGDIFESLAGAVYLDSGMSLDTVWRVYYPLMKPQIEQYAANLPISPVRELLEMEPETARFGPPERTMDGKTRVTVNVVGKGRFKGIGRNYRIAKATAARCALRHLKSQAKK